MTSENPQAPPSSAEEAAALLGAAISLAAIENTSGPNEEAHNNKHPNPPPGMHSIFAVQSPVPNGVLFVRLCNLREWLRWHAEEDVECGGVEDPIKQSFQVSFPPRDKSPEPFTAARSILAVLMKLLEVTSSISESDEKDNKPLSGLGSPKTKHKRPPKQHKPLPPLLSTPIRTVWVHCVALCISLGSSLPGKQRTDVYAFITKMMEIANMNPRSKLASGGVRHAALMVIQRICTLNTEMAKRSAPYAWEILQCCHRGLMSGGTGEPGHRAQCVKVACGLMIGCRKASKDGEEKTFVMPGALEERVVVEVIKFMKRAAADKYPEVRMASAILAGLTAPMLIRNPSIRKDSEGVSPLAWLEDVTQVALRNLDDESAGVATAWAQSLARCLCASTEYGKSVRDAQSEDQANKRSADMDDEDVMKDNNNLDFAGKFKAFSESRRAAAATSVCSSTSVSVKFLVSNFVKCGGESTNNRCGGSFSIGGRASRIGYAMALTDFLRLQSAGGELAFTEALPLVLDMIGESFEKQVNRSDHKKSQSSADSGVYAPSSPYSSPEKKPQPSISSAFLNKSLKTSSSDSTIGRLLASLVIRRGISENLSELSQLSILKELTTACSISIAPTALDGSLDSSRSPNCHDGSQLNRHQLQVSLGEMSHLITTLGEAGAASLGDIVAVLKDCLAHHDHGVRLEAASAYAAVAQAFPTEGRKFIIESLSGFSANMDAIQSLSMRVASEAMSTPKSRFRRGQQDPVIGGSGLSEELMHHQCHMHGNALAVSILMHQFPHVFGGVPRVIVDKTYDVCEKLLQCQSNDSFVKANPNAVCTCIRAGYSILSGMFAMGVDAVVHHVQTIFRLWQATVMNVLPGVSKQSSSHDLLCVESMLSSVVAFLKFSPTLLLSVPDALNRTTSLLEKIFPLVSLGGKFENEGTTSIGSATLSNTRSAVMEAYSWLPPGSFPMSADRIFTFAAKQIQELSGNEISCSILNRLVNREDDLVDAHTAQRTVSSGQAGHFSMVDVVVSIRTCDIATSYERESTLNLVSWRETPQRPNQNEKHYISAVLGTLFYEDDTKPTPLHEVGTWRQPLDPIPTVRVRLLDSSIHVFAATFGLQDPHTQSDALRMLESLYISTQTEKSNRFNVNTALITDSQGKVRQIEEDAITFNVTAVVLACLQAIPLHEATYGTLIGKGPPWMERATNILLQLIPSQSDVIRRGAAEGLSFLATLGVSEDANTLQSTILHALDEVMKGNNLVPNQKTSTDFISSGRAGSLLSLACIQRTSKRMEETRIARASHRSVSHSPNSQEKTDAPPVLIMMTRLLPSLATHSPEMDSSIVRAHAIHAFGLLICNSFPKPDHPLTPDQIQIARKAIEAVETSFLGAWSAVVFDYNKGREREKFASEPALVAAICRLMTTLLPWLPQIIDFDQWTASRFSCYAAAMSECLEHPTNLFEVCVFFESLSSRQKLVHPQNCCVTRTSNTAAIAMPLLMSAIRPGFMKMIADDVELIDCSTAILQRSAVLCLSRMCSESGDFIFNIRGDLCLFLHDFCGRRRFQYISNTQSLVQSHAYRYFNDQLSLETQTAALISSALNAQTCHQNNDQKTSTLLKWLLFSRCLVSGTLNNCGQDDPDTEMAPFQRAINDVQTIVQSEAALVMSASNPPRWQLKCIAANAAFLAVKGLMNIDVENLKDSSMFNFTWAESKCIERLNNGDGCHLSSFPAFHLEELVLTACSASAATSNHSELVSVQIAGIRLLSELFKAFSTMLDTTTNDGASVLEQYSSQIVSAVKHSLKSEPSEESIASGYHLLFSAGCDAFLILIENDFVSDLVVLKRLIKAVMLPKEDTLFVKFPSGTESHSLVTNPHSITDDMCSHPSFRLSKLCFIAKISTLAECSAIKQSVVDVIMQEFETNEEGRAVHAAAAAIDGFLLTSGFENAAGLTFKNRADLDCAVIKGLVTNWSTLCSSSISSLVKAIKSTDAQDHKKELFCEWLDKVSVIAFSGLKQLLAPDSSLVNEKVEQAQSCIYAIRLLIRDNAFVSRSVLQPSELSDVISLVTQSVIYTSLESQGTVLTENDPSQLLKQSCWLLEDSCQHPSLFDSFLPILHEAVLRPLCSLQDGKFTTQGHNDFIISICMRSSACLLRTSPKSNREKLEKALSQFALTTLIKLKPKNQTSLSEVECISVLRACLEESDLSSDEWRQVALFTAASELWGAWSAIISHLPLGIGIECSLQSIKKSLGNLSTLSSDHVIALCALRNGLQSAIAEVPNLTGLVLHVLGFEVLQLFRYHSTDMVRGAESAEDRLMLCAECIKIVMMAYQYLTAVSIEDNRSVGFLSPLFSLLVESILYNGLPNNPSGKAGADERIGKMCAQVFVHIARTSPSMFKLTVAAVSPEGKSTIEAAVRADMSGYASASQVPSKKKLNLKGFVR